MLFTRLKLFPIFFTITLSILSCSGGYTTTENPAAPDFPDTGSPSITRHEPASDESNENTHVLWGYFEIFIDPDDEDGIKTEIIPVRNAADHWNTLSWLEQWPCTDCFSLEGVTPSGSGTLLVDVKITHPFGNLNLTGFDVRGIAMFGGSTNFPTDNIDVPNRWLGDGELVNADGYTALYNYSTQGEGPGGLQGYIDGKFSGQPPTANANGYKRHITDDPGNTRNALYAGDSITVTYEVDMPDGAFMFGYAVDACWAPPQNSPVTDPMVDFGPEANCPEPWKLEITEQAVGTGLTDIGNDYITVSIKIFDYEGNSTYQKAELECPEIFAGTISSSHTGSGPDFEVYVADVHNTFGATAGDYKCLVSVEDLTPNPPAWMDLTAYHVYTLTVNEFVDLPPVAQAAADPATQVVCENVHFFDDNSYDQDDGGIVLYEWDWDNDGLYDSAGDDVYHSFDSVGTHYVQFRVTDDEGTTDDLDDPLQIEIENNLPTAVADVDKTTASVDEIINFDATGSVDNDCANQEIVSWEWDWENDGTYDLNASSTQYTYSEPGVYEVQLRVTDDEGGTDTLDNPIEITVTESTWAITIGDDGNEKAHDSDTDDSGNIYVVGRCHFGVDFDPGPGQTDPSSSGAFIAKYDNNGNYLWSHVFYSNNTYNQFTAVFVDGSNNVYMAGRFAQTVDFDPGAGTHNHSSAGYSDVILLKLDQNGDYLWSRSFGGSELDQAFDVAITSTKIYICGTFEGTADFDPLGGGTFRTAIGETDCFLTSFNLSGVLQWVNTWGGNDSILAYADYARSVAADGLGNVYVTGAFHSLCDFDPGPGFANRTSAGEMDFYLVGYSSTGNLMWVNAWGSNSNYESGFGVAIDAGSYVYAVGRFEDTVDFDCGPSNHFEVSTGQYDAFLVKYDWNGDFQWVETWGGALKEQGADIEISGAGIVYACGTFESIVDFDPGPGHVDLTSNGAEDIFILTYNTDGTFNWANAIGGADPDGDWGLSVTYDQNGSAFVCGYFHGSADFDPGVETDYRISNGMEDFFLSKFLADGSW